MNISVALLQESNHVGKLNQNINHRYLVSLLSDGDLNLNNQALQSEKWLSSTTGSYPDLHSWGAIVAWIPFYAYVIVLGQLKLTNFNCVVDQVDFAQALAAIFFLTVLFINAFKIQKNFEKKNKLLLLLTLFFFSTPAWWYALIEPSGPLLIYLVVFSMILFYLFSLEKKQLKSTAWIIIGSLSYMLAAIQSSGYFSFFGIFLFVVFLKIKRLIVLKDFVFYVAGVTSVLTLEVLNIKIKFGQMVTPFNFINNKMFGAEQSKFMIYDSLFGPAGILYMFPGYIISIVGLALLNYEILAGKKTKSVENYLTIALTLSAVLNYFFSINYWFPERDFLGAGFFESQLILFIGFVYFFKKNMFRAYGKIFFLCSFVWSLLVMANYYLDRSVFGLQNIMDRLRLIFGTLQLDASAIFYNFRDTFVYSIFWLPVIFCIVFATHLFAADSKNWKIFIKFSSICIIFSFILISLLNVFQNFTAHTVPAELQDKQIISEDIELFSYIQYMSFLQRKQELAIQSNNKERALAIKYKIIVFNQFILANFKKIPSFFNLESALQGGSLFKNSFDSKIINRQKHLCTIKSEQVLY